jgi:hypothetical protein
MLIESLILSVSVMNHYGFINNIMGGISICLLRHGVNRTLFYNNALDTL